MIFFEFKFKYGFKARDMRWGGTWSRPATGFEDPWEDETMDEGIFSLCGVFTKVLESLVEWIRTGSNSSPNGSGEGVLLPEVKPRESSCPFNSLNRVGNFNLIKALKVLMMRENI